MAKIGRNSMKLHIGILYKIRNYCSSLVIHYATSVNPRLIKICSI